MLVKSTTYLPEWRGAATVKSEVFRLPLPYAGRVKSVRALAGSAPAGELDTVFNVRVAGGSVFAATGDRPKLAPGQTVSALAVPNADPRIFTAGQTLVVDCVSVSETPPQNLSFVLVIEFEGVPENTLLFTASAAVTQYRAVRVMSDGTIRNAGLSPNDAWKVIGVAVEGAANGDLCHVQAFGPIDNPAWEWSPGTPVYLDEAGVLTEEVPAEGFVRPIGFPLSPTKLFLVPYSPLPIPATLEDFFIEDAVRLQEEELGDEQTGNVRLSGLMRVARLLLGGAPAYAGSNKLVVGSPNQNYEDAEIVVSPTDEDHVCLILERKTETQSTALLRVVDENGNILGEINQTAGWNAPASTTYVATVQCSLIQSAGNLDVRIVGTDRLHFEYTGDIVVRDNTRLVENVKTLTPGATVALSSIQGNCFVLTPDQDCTINVNNSYPDALYNGQEFDVVVVSSGATSRVVTLGTGFLTDDATIDTGTEDGKRFILSFRVVGGVAIERSRKGPM